MAVVCLKMCNSLYLIPTRITCMLVVLLQGAVLDYYLVSNKNIYWYSWIIADIAVLLVFAMAFIISYRHLLLAKNSLDKNTPIQTGALPLSYFAWFFYSGLLATRVAIIFRDFAFNLNEKDFFGPNMLKIDISLAAVVFLLLLLSQHDATANSERKRIIAELTGTVVFDVLDSVDVLDILFEQKDITDFPAHVDTVIIVISCVNLILPTLPLMTLSRIHYGHKKAPGEILMLHKLLLVFFVNLPLLIIRLLLWHMLDEEISIFPVKNVIFIFIVFHELYEKRQNELENQKSVNGIEELTDLQQLKTVEEDV